MRRRAWSLALATLVVVGGCDDEDKTPFEPGLDRRVVVGVYEITRLTFDPHGSLPEIDVVDLLDPAIQPRFVVAADGTVQIAFIEPATGKFIAPEGTYETLTDGIRVEFEKDEAAKQVQGVLLPRKVDLVYMDTNETLSYAGDSDVALARLVDLVPAWKNEQLRDPVRGRLEIVFRRRPAD